MRTRRTSRKEMLHGAPVHRETQWILTCLRPLVEPIAKTFGSQLEVVLHNLQKPEKSIVAIANGQITGRHVGGPVIGGPVNDKALQLLREEGNGTRALVNYSTRTRDGRELKSSSIVYYSRSTSRPIVALCLNYYLTAMQTARSVLDAALRTDGVQSWNADEGAEHGGAVDLEKTIQSMIDQAIRTHGKPVPMMDKSENAQLLALSTRRGSSLSVVQWSEWQRRWVCRDSLSTTT